MSQIGMRLTLLGAVVVFSAAACGGAAPSAAPAATLRPAPTPVGEVPTPSPGRIVVGSPFDAGSLVVASNPLFEGVGPRREDVIGQDRYWVATPLAGGRFRIDVTIGWGDCPAGCIEKHIWTYEVWPDGSLELVGEVGPELPPDLR